MLRAKRYNTKSLYFSVRIIEALEGILDYPLTIVEAPMGYGKTTAVREFLYNSEVNTLWQRIDDSDKTAYWKGFCRLIGALNQDCAESLIQLEFPKDSVSKQEALQLIKDIEMSKRTVLVMDDYHLVHDSEVDSFVKFLVTEEIEHLHIVLITRFIKFNNMEELSLRGHLYYISKESFILNPDEIRKYYRMCGINLNDLEVEKLDSYTEGWIGALYLIMMNYHREGSFKTAENIYKLLEEAIYEPFSEEIKQFLLSISVFESFTLDQAEYMWSKENVKEILAEIINKNALVNYDLQSKTYQFHNIFTKFLRDEFEKKSHDYRQHVLAKTANWHLKAGDYLAAMNGYFIASDFDGLLYAIEVDKGHSIHNEQKESFINYFERCPEGIKNSHPIALLIYGLCLFSFNEVDRFEKVCGEFMAAIKNNDQLEQENINELMGEFELLLNFTCYNDISRMSEHLKKAEMLLDHPAKFIDTQGGFTFGSPSILYMFYRETGTLKKEVEVLKEALPYYNRITNGHGTGGEFVMEAEWHYNRGEMESAEIISNKALYLANKYGQEEILICAVFLQARLALYKGDYSYILYTFHRLREEMKQKKWYNLIHTIDLCETFVHCALRRHEKVPVWILNGDFDSSRLYFPAIAFFNIVYGRSMLINKEYYKLLGLEEYLRDMASVFPNLLGQIYAIIHIAAANQRVYRREDAVRTLKEALDLAIPDEVYMPFAENCDYIEPTLKELQLQHDYHEPIVKILELYRKYQISLEQITKTFFIDKKPELTEREMEIAKLAAEGFSNKEIAGRLYITQNTVKTLLKRVFEKLEINSRALLKQHFEEESKI